MSAAFAAADLLLCRAGASTVAEICAAGRAAVLVPYPHATGQHQLRNAEALEERGAALVVPDRELTGPKVATLVGELRGDPARIRRMGEAARALGRPDAAARVARMVLGLLEAA
jgi:UDP-N-acetylglucosamine--N-acetylmuramyl-(pentapeptide) pyrophosphoryl-undecaprenol N-acetylglucosamine transferase